MQTFIKLKLNFPLVNAVLHFFPSIFINTFPNGLINKLNIGELYFLYVFVITSYRSVSTLLFIPVLTHVASSFA